jgi:GTP pyrophosphokinase
LHYSRDRSTPHLADLLARPSAQVLGAPVREALLRQAASAGDVGAPLQAPWPVIADMLGALDTLAADESTVTAALLFDLPGLRAAVLPMLPQHRDAIAGLLDGQDAADQVWALHAGREAGRNSEGLRRLLLSIVHDLRVVPILLARQLARLRAATHQPDSPERRALAQLTRDIHRAAGQPPGHLAIEVGAGGSGVPLPAAGYLQAHRARWTSAGSSASVIWNR